LALIEEHRQSGLTQEAFCAKYGINAKYFSLKRSRLRIASQQSGFVRVEPVQSAVNTEALELRYGAVALRIPATVSIDFVSTLMKGLV
jgi:hypothetical protein